MTPEERMRLLRNEDEWTFTLSRRASPFPVRRQASPWLVSLATIAAVAVIGVIVFSVFGLGIRSARPVAPPVAPTQTAVPSPVATPTSTPTPSQSADKAPASRFVFTCSDLATDAEISELVGTSVAAVDALGSPLSAFWSIPREGAIERVGGLVCEWNNGVPYNSIAGTYQAGKPHIGLQVMLLPDSAQGWKKAGITGDSYAGCSGKYCNASSLIGSTWEQTYVQGMVAGGRSKAQRVEAFTQVQKNIETVVANHGEPTGQIGSAADTLPQDCTQYVTDDQLSAAVGLDMTTSTSGDGGGGGWSLEAEAMEQAGFRYSCQWGSAADDYKNLITLSVLPGGSWIPTDYADVVAPQGAATKLLLPTLPESDSAWIRCDMKGKAPENYCIIDIAIGGNWIELESFPDQGGWENPKRPLNQVLEDVADAVAGSLK